MTLTLDLIPEVEQKLTRQAAAAGKPLADYAADLIFSPPPLAAG